MVASSSRKTTIGVAVTATPSKKQPVKAPKSTATRNATVVKKTPVPTRAASAAKSTKPALAATLTNATKSAKVAKAPILAVKPAIASPTKPTSVAAPSAAAQAKVRATEKIKKPKLVRDSFTMPEAEYAALGEVKKACLKAGFEVKKSELLRIGVALVRKMALAVLKQEVGALAPLKPGRPPKQS